MNKLMILLTAVIIAIAGIAIGAFLFIQSKQAQTSIDAPRMAEQMEAQYLVEQVSHFISLPEGESPTVATVSDYEKLKDQPFFSKSQNGDKVLVYTQARKAYLYRPSTDKLIDVTIINVDPGIDSESAVASADQGLQEINIVLRNGTSEAGLTNQFEPEIKKVLPNSTIVKNENAASDSYQTTTVVVLNEDANDAGLTLADSLKATVAILPSDESKPNDADIVIIIGKDKVPSPPVVGQ